ncbi:hypothetical protein [Streptomyces pilosus]|nr:hypothetical protein [Streptomyces pilosus]
MHAATQRPGRNDDVGVPAPLVLLLCRSAAAWERTRSAGRVGAALGGS